MVTSPSSTGGEGNRGSPHPQASHTWELGPLTGEDIPDHRGPSIHGREPPFKVRVLTKTRTLKFTPRCKVRVLGKSKTCTYLEPSYSALDLSYAFILRPLLSHDFKVRVLLWG